MHISKHNGVVNQIIGDGLMALFGTISQNSNYRKQVVRAALDMMDVLEVLCKGKQQPIQIFAVNS